MWITSYNRVWIIRGDIKTLVLCGMSDIDFLFDSIKQWICSYCKSVNDSLNCEHCNAPRKTRRRKGRLFLSGTLPLCQILDDLTDNFSIEVLHGECCDPRRYEAQQIIMIASNCKVKAKGIGDMVAMMPDEVTQIVINLDIECDISLRFPK